MGSERIRAKSSRRLPGVGHLRKGPDVIGDGAAQKEAQLCQRDVVVGVERRRWCRQNRSLRVGVSNNCHHRDRRHPSLLLALVGVGGGGDTLCQERRHIAPSAGVVGAGEQRRSIGAAARGVAAYLEEAAIRGKSGKIGVTGTAGLTGLPRVTWQGLCRRGKYDQQKSNDCERRHGSTGAPETPGAVIGPTTFAPHCHARSCSSASTPARRFQP